MSELDPPSPEPLFACNRPVPCPEEWREKIEQYVDRNAADLPEQPEAYFHERFHEAADSLTRADPETFSWNRVWQSAVMRVTSATWDLRQEARGETWEFEEGRFIRWRPGGVELLIDRGKTQVHVPVITGYLRPERSVTVEGWTYFQTLIAPGQRVTASAEELLKRLERDGRIRKRKLGHDVLIEVLWKMAPDPVAVYPVYGIYALPTGALELCRAPVPVRDEQLKVQEEISDGLAYAPQPSDLQGYADFASHFHPYEVYPVMAMSAISPVAQALRASDVFVPHVWHYALAHGLGKSLTQFVFSRNLWKRVPASGDAVNREFRLSAHLDAGAVPLTIDEAEQLDMRRLGAILKMSVERPIASRRGTTTLTMDAFGARCCLFFNGNRLVPVSGPSLSRFLATRFDSGKQAERKAAKPELDRLVRGLQPVGHALAEKLIVLHPRIESLLEEIRDTEAAIARTGAAQGDIRRPQAWAVAHSGLRVWESVFADFGVKWRAPTVAEFVDQVVVPVDQFTYEGEETVVDAFRSWFESWRARNVTKVTNIEMAGGRERYRHDEEIRGAGALFIESELKVDGRSIPGVWVTKALTDEYNRQAVPDLKIGSLPELAAAAADEAHIPHDSVLDAKGNVKRQSFPQRPSVRAAFVPREPGGE